MHHRRVPTGRFAAAREWAAVLCTTALALGYAASTKTVAITRTAAAIRLDAIIKLGGGRRTTAAVATAIVSAALLISGATIVLNRPAEPITAAPSSAEVRRQAADRADRSGRSPLAQSLPSGAAAPAPAPSASATPAPAAKAAPKAVAKAPAWVLPISGAVLTSCYGARWGTMHLGIDLAAPYGNKIMSVGVGTVISAGWNYAGYGISVVVDHGNGYLTHYAHASKALVAVGAKVKAGTPLALEGSTGDSTGPHLHFEVHRGALWNQIEPAAWLRSHGVRVGC